MIPRTLSASSLQVAALCLDRWRAEYMNRASNFSNSAADVGTAVHGGLEKFVQAVYIDKTHAGLDRVQQKELLISFYMMSYVETFQSADTDTAEYKDGFDLTMKWFARTDLSKVEEVLSVEVKKTIRVPYNHPDGAAHQPCANCQGTQYEGNGRCVIPFNYIMDRVDRIGDEEYEVVDYKSIRVPLDPEDLESKLQARAYALAIQIEHPNAAKIKVTFDLLRHEKISLWFTRDDNIRFWNFLVAEAQRIVDTKPEDVRPTLNMECGYCVKKFDCKVLQSNVNNGGIHSLDIGGAAKLKAELQDKMKAFKGMIEALDEKLFIHAAQNDMLEWETEDGAYEVEVTSSRRRQVDTIRAAEIMGPELFAQLGSITLGKLDELIKDPGIPAETREALKATIGYGNGNLGLKVKPKKKII